MLSQRITLVNNGESRITPIEDKVIQESKTQHSALLFNIDDAAYRQILLSVKPNRPNAQAIHVRRHILCSTAEIFSLSTP
ncbi:hypothetical protein GBFDFA_09360 [Edwardsiella anguillarum]|nr:hypothetical protein PBOPBF_09365 [Edwardsiella anguillarum]BET84335.1 hypothetical protein GHNJMD_09670 [Edwardsiella anguillarum]BET87702.1 hypothetical protein GBFDFA_09360 [Edwardsiella anguillarum]BET91130.1 hypothetical protein BIKEJJ_09375 [Edwardsiella anguillarum]